LLSFYSVQPAAGRVKNSRSPYNGRKAELQVTVLRDKNRKNPPQCVTFPEKERQKGS
jgi:hypothetical protein